MVLLLFLHDGADGFDRLLINGVKLSELVLQVAQNHPLNRDRCSSDCTAAEDRSYEAEHEAAGPAKVVAAATPNAASLKLGLKNRAVSALVRLELSKLAQHAASRKPSDQALPRVDIDRAVLARMVDLEDSLGETLGGAKWRDQFHEAQRASSAGGEAVRCSEGLNRFIERPPA